MIKFETFFEFERRIVFCPASHDNNHIYSESPWIELALGKELISTASSIKLAPDKSEEN
jgi:hypothetical protein